MRLTLAFLLALALVACGGKLADDTRDGAGSGRSPGRPASGASGASSANDSSDEDPPVDERRLPRPKRTDLQLQALASAQCRGWSECGLSGPRIFVGQWGDQASCVAKKSDELATSLATRGVTVTQAQLDACAARKARTPCESGVPECELTGSLPNGDTCSTDEQCQSGTCSFPLGDYLTYCGTCSPRASAGEKCASDPDCAIGLTCNAVTKKCMSPLPAGASCTAEENICGPGLTCLGGACTERLPLGSPCVARGPIKYGYYDDCAAGSWCKSDTLVCTAFAKVEKTAGLGESCDDDVIVCRASSCNPTRKRCEARAPLPDRPVCR